jgi:hypothetical protein
MEGYDSDDNDKTNELIQAASEQCYAYIHLINLDQYKYGSILKNLNYQKFNPTQSFMQLEGKCCCCGKLSLKLLDCNKQDKIPCNKGAINKVQLMQNKNSKTSRVKHHH